MLLKGVTPMTQSYNAQKIFNKVLEITKLSGTIDYIACKLDVFIIRLYGLNEHPDCCVTTSNSKNQVITYTYTT